MSEIVTAHGKFTANEITGQSAQEIYEAWLMKELQPSEQEVADSELEIKILTLLMEMEVI